MLGRLNHVAIAVPDLEAAAGTYRDKLGATVSAPLPQPAHGVTVVFVEVENTKIELRQPAGRGLARSPASWRRIPSAASTTCASRSTDILAARDALKAAGLRVLGDGEPKIGAHDKPVCSCTPRILTAPWSSCSRPDRPARPRDALTDEMNDVVMTGCRERRRRSQRQDSGAAAAKIIAAGGAASARPARA